LNWTFATPAGPYENYEDAGCGFVAIGTTLR
jgi:hypothetical protein